MAAKKLVYVISNIDKSIGFEWLAQKLNRKELEVSFVLLNPVPSKLSEKLRDLGYNVEEWRYRGKRDIPVTLRKLLKRFRKDKPDIVHAHLFDASITAMFTAWIAGISKRIYTRHHADYHQKYHPRAVKYDRAINRFSTHIVAISENVKEILVEQEGVAADKISIINHGFDMQELISKTREDGIALATKYNSNDRHPVVGVISRYIHWKGLQYIIPAFKELLKEFPNAFLVLANARGDYKKQVSELLMALPPESFVEIEFEHDIFSLYQIFDVFVHTPIDRQCEAFGQTYIESLAAGVPSVFTISGVAADFIKDRRNAYVVDYMNADQITEALTVILNNKEKFHEMLTNGRKDVIERFDLDRMIKKTEGLYK